MTTDLTGFGALKSRFAEDDSPEAVIDTGDFEVVTGFGPTNAPTAGTLSVMCGIIEIQRALKAPVTVVISDLGAWNCRNVAWNDLCNIRDRMAALLALLGFDKSRGVIRSHLDIENLTRAGMIARFLKLDDFEEHQEEFLALYNSEGLLGSRVGLLIDTLYTVADILQPIHHGRAGSLVACGREESYFTRLAKVVLERQASEVPGLGWRGIVGGLYFRIVRGLAGYPKMSKSIERSSLHLGLSDKDIAKRILSTSEDDQAAIMDSIDLASDWSDAQRAAARAVFENLPASARDWHLTREAYVETFMKFARLWTATAPT